MPPCLDFGTLFYTALIKAPVRGTLRYLLACALFALALLAVAEPSPRYPKHPSSLEPDTTPMPDERGYGTRRPATAHLHSITLLVQYTYNASSEHREVREDGKIKGTVSSARESSTRDALFMLSTAAHCLLA